MSNSNNFSPKTMRTSLMVTGLVLGIALGVALGVAQNDLTIGLAAGVAIGVSLGWVLLSALVWRNFAKTKANNRIDDDSSRNSLILSVPNIKRFSFS